MPANPAQMMLKIIAPESTSARSQRPNQTQAITPMTAAKTTLVISATEISLPQYLVGVGVGEVAGGERAHGDSHDLHSGVAPIAATIGISTASATNCSIVVSNREMTLAARMVLNSVTRSHLIRRNAV
jgi:hypothetical protein